MKTLTNFAAASVLIIALAGPLTAQQESDRDVSGRQTASAPTAPDVSGLNAALRISPTEVQKAISRGEELAHKSAPAWEIYRKFQRTPKWLRRRDGTAGDYALCLGLEGTHITRKVFEAARKYEDPQIPPQWLANGTYTSDLVFEVKLVSAPVFGLTGDAQVSNLVEALANLAQPTVQNIARNSVLHKNDMELKAAANIANVTAEKFVLSDDRGHFYTAEIARANQSEGAVNLNTERTAVNVSEVRARSTVITKGVVPYSQTHPCFEATYIVRFPLFDADGSARIGTDVKELTLHIITENGEGVATYKLNAR